MLLDKTVRNLSLSLLVLASTSVLPAFAQVYLNIGIAPPEVQYEVIPNIPRGNVWVPGHWAWHNDGYVWVRGRTVAQRVGYVWAPDRWEQRGQYYYRNPGRWQRDVQVVPEQPRYVRPLPHRDNGNHFGQLKNGNRDIYGHKVKKDKKEKKEKHEKKEKRDKGDKD